MLKLEAAEEQQQRTGISRLSCHARTDKVLAGNSIRNASAKSTRKPVLGKGLALSLAEWSLKLRIMKRFSCYQMLTVEGLAGPDFHGPGAGGQALAKELPIKN
jgi:hypothetical protein